jgi:uncharacterized membrane protein
VTGLLAVAALVRVPGLTRWAFEPDELSTWRDALSMAGPSANGPGALGRPVYYLLQHGVLGVLPGSPLSLRLPALVFGLLGVWLTWVVGRRLFGDIAGLVAGLLVALSPWHQYASGFARYWTLVYVLALASTLLLIEGMDRDDPKRLRWAALAFTLGALTHPTFLFPMVGALLALHLMGPDCRVSWRWPSRAAWLNLWVPFLVVFGGWLVWLKISGNGRALSNFNGRGIGATLDIFAGMAEWTTLPVVVATVLGAFALSRNARGDDRRWAFVALGALATGCLLLLLAGRKTDVYADYGMSMLPFIYVTVGAAVDRALGTLTPVAVAAAVILVAGALPGVLSNLRDGMRFDPRPALAYVQAHGPARLVLGPSVQQKAYYAADLQFEEIGDAARLPQVLTRTGGFWLLESRHRNGWINGGSEAQAWVDRVCHVVLRTGKMRFDFRAYDVDLHWCGDSAP